MTDSGTKVLFIAGFGPIDRSIKESRELYGDSFGISFCEDSGGYLYTSTLQGAKHFALRNSLCFRRGQLLAPSRDLCISDVKGYKDWYAQRKENGAAAGQERVFAEPSD
ncbi:MAG TPA: hypothetical protein VME86_08675 [Acidobacteriaceae bacterium]|nr:hypothetical protein [Acidobacteriaceae bacterium]